MIRVTTAIFCDVCLDWLEITTICTERPYTAQVRKIRQEAKSEGWLCAVRIPGGGLEDYCPKCQAEADGD